MPPKDTRDPTYAARLAALEEAPWKRLLDVQRPYRRHLARLHLGFTLDLGCGRGRNLAHLRAAGDPGVGVDHNPDLVAACRARGLEAYLPEAFAASPHARPGRFDSLLCAHVVEHMTFAEAQALLARYLVYVRPGGRVVLITPQEAGFRADPTHVEPFDVAALRRLAAALGLEPLVDDSFPLPRAAGRVFPHNEHVLVAARR
jgi:SAM-dependent methyltransferase